MGRSEQDLTIQDYYSEIVVNEMRNQLIIDDVVTSHQQGRSSLVLTERTAHVKLLAKALSEKIPDVISLTGKMGTKETGVIFKRISETPADRQLTLVATGKYIGEGFDEPRLDTLFLTMPISWKGNYSTVCREASPAVCRQKGGADLRLCRYSSEDAGKDVRQATQWLCLYRL